MGLKEEQLLIVTCLSRSVINRKKAMTRFLAWYRFSSMPLRLQAEKTKKEMKIAV